MAIHKPLTFRIRAMQGGEHVITPAEASWRVPAGPGDPALAGMGERLDGGIRLSLSGASPDAAGGVDGVRGALVDVATACRRQAKCHITLAVNPIDRQADRAPERSRLFSSLGLLLEAGIPMLDALPLALNTIADSSIKGEFSRIAPRVAGGATLAQAIADSSFLGYADSRGRTVALIDTGEQSGTARRVWIGDVMNDRQPAFRPRPYATSNC